MGPLILIDKSFLQSLTLDEAHAMWRHYQVLICPTLIHEMAGNLLSEGNKPSDKSIRRVLDLAYKAYGLGSRTIGHYEAITKLDLLTGGIKLRAQIPRFDGVRVVNSKGENGLVLEESMEGRLLTRWSQGIFTQPDYETALDHLALKQMDFTRMMDEVRAKFPGFKKERRLEDVERFVTELDLKHPNPWEAITAYSGNVNLITFEYPKMYLRWIANGKPVFPKFSSYAYHCSRLEQIFVLGVMSQLIPTGKRQKSWIDYQYFYYAPFAHLFCSSDKFQLSFSKYFLRSDQDWISGRELKADLGNIAKYMGALTKDQWVEYDRNYGSYPPPVQNSLTCKIFEKHFGPRSKSFGNRAYDMSAAEEAALMARIKELETRSE